MSAFERAEVLFDQGRFDLAERYFRQALATNPENAAAMAALAFCLIKQEKVSESAEIARTAVARSPDLAYAHYVLGVALSQQRKLDAAADALHTALGLDPHDSRYHAMLGIVYMRQRKREQALRCADAGLAIAPTDRDCLNLRALVLGLDGDTAASQHTIESSLSVDPEYALTHAHQGFLLLRRGRYADAEATFAEALRVNPMLRYAQRGSKLARAARHPLLGLPGRFMIWLGWMPRWRRLAVLLVPVIAVCLLAEAEAAAPSYRALLEGMQSALVVLIWVTALAFAWVRFILLRPPRRR